jgi:hypothetical protein
VWIAVKVLSLVQKIKSFINKRDILPLKDVLFAEQIERQITTIAEAAAVEEDKVVAVAAAAITNLNIKPFVAPVDVKLQFLLNPGVTNQYTVLLAIEIDIKENILAKNKQKKEKAERNKAYANQYKKRSSNGKFGRRNSNNDK